MNRVLVTRYGGAYAAYEMDGERVYAVNVARDPQMLADLQFSAAYPIGTVFRWIVRGRGVVESGKEENRKSLTTTIGRLLLRSCFPAFLIRNPLRRSAR